MNKRLEMLEQMAKTEGADAFTLYGLAMEYRRLERFAESLEVFERLRSAYPDYVPTYLMAGQMLLSTDAAQARAWLEAGVEVASRAGDSKAQGELEDALEQLTL